MGTDTRTSAALRMGRRGALVLTAGILLSGPVGIAVVSAVHAPGPWSGAAAYAAGYHRIETFPFFCGFLLLVGAVMVMAALHRIAEEARRPYTTVALVLTAAFTGLITFNYIAQTTFVPDLVANRDGTTDALIGMLSLANPHSLCWAIEMWGYALLGAATWFAAPVFGRAGMERATAIVFVLNGLLSIAGGVITAIDLGWVFTSAGLVSYAAWNVVMVVLALLVFIVFKRRETSPASAEGAAG